VLLVAHYTPHAWLRESTLRFEAEIIDKVFACARSSGLPTLDTREAFERAVREGGLDRYYINLHMTDAGNQLTAELIANRLRAGRRQLQHRARPPVRLMAKVAEDFSMNGNGHLSTERRYFVVGAEGKAATHAPELRPLRC